MSSNWECKPWRQETQADELPASLIFSGKGNDQCGKARRMFQSSSLSEYGHTAPQLCTQQQWKLFCSGQCEWMAFVRMRNIQGGSQTCLYEGWSSPAHNETLSSDNQSKAMNFTSRFIFKTKKQWKQLNTSLNSWCCLPWTQQMFSCRR